MWGCCSNPNPARPFRTFQNKAWVSSNVGGGVAEGGGVETAAAILRPLTPTLPRPDPNFPEPEDRYERGEGLTAPDQAAEVTSIL